MNRVYNKIKKQNGESFAKAIRDHHNGIFEVPDILDIVKHAGKTAQDAEQCLTYLTSLLTTEPEEETKPEDPFVLLKKAGYSAFYADTLHKQNSIRKYFASGEALCTFSDSSRFKNYYIVNCVHEQADKLVRSDFSSPKREDDYGVSVISIQIAKTGGFISIKNRYNHKVPNCDNTFGSNPDNIIPGLSAALQAHFKVKFSKKNNLIDDSYSLVGRKLFKINQEINGILYGDHAYVQNGELHEVLPENNEYLFDYFIFDAAKKEFRIVDKTLTDSFPEAFNGCYAGKSSVYVRKHCIYDGDTMLVGV